MPVAVKPNIKKIVYFVGIDVSKYELDFALLKGKKLLFHREIKNIPDEINQFMMEVKALPGFAAKKVIFCMENTGSYCNYILNALRKLKAPVVLENPIHIKKSLGLTREKHDKIDAIRIAQFAQRNREEHRFWTPQRPVVELLRSLAVLRDRLINTANKINTPIMDMQDFLPATIRKSNLQLCKKSVGALKADLKNVESKIDTIIKNDEHLNTLKKVITSVPGVGPVTALQIIITTNEFKGITDPRKFACYAGIAPFITESGLFRSRAKVSPIANRKMKSLLHMCALKAITIDPELRSYYLRKTVEEKKAKMLVLNAVRNKLILRVFACLKENRLYSTPYQSLSVKAKIEMQTL
jgi:transposase